MRTTTAMAAPTNQSARQNWPPLDFDLPTSAPVLNCKSRGDAAPTGALEQGAGLCQEVNRRGTRGQGTLSRGPYVLLQLSTPACACSAVQATCSRPRDCSNLPRPITNTAPAAAAA